MSKMFEHGKSVCTVVIRKFVLKGFSVCSTKLPTKTGMKVIRHAGVDSRMIILDDQACQQMTLHFHRLRRCMPDKARDGRNVALK